MLKIAGVCNSALRAQTTIVLGMLLAIGTATAAEPREGFVAANGVRLHYLDFGGTGPTVVLLHGQGNTAHIFREFAPGLTDRYRVVALTRRGHGQSDAPKDGYDPLTLAADVRAAMDALKIDRAAIIGHSMAGEEMTALAANWLQRVTALVYLDAALDRFNLAEDDAAADPFVASANPLEADRASKDALRSFWRRFEPSWSESLERDFQAGLYQLSDGGWASGTKPGVDEKIDAGRRSYRYEYARLTVPALAIYATPRRYPQKYVPPDATPEQLAAAQVYVDGDWGPWLIGSISHFRREVPCAHIIEIPDADHYVFFSNRNEILAYVRAFLAEARCPSGFATSSG